MPKATQDLWRISNRHSLSGEGGLKYAARWHSVGRRIVYLAESPAGAMLEVLVHLELEEDELPSAYTLLHIKAPDEVVREEICVSSGHAWKTDHALSRRLGDEWLARGVTALARVPSALLPHTFNCLLNPLHVETERITIAGVSRAAFDLRLLKRLRR